MQKVPKQVIIEATSRCNLQCKFCPNVTNKDFPVGNMSVPLFKHIVDLVAKEMPETTVIPWMNGEPFMNENYLEMVQYLSKLGLKFYVTTNLTIWNDELIKFLLSDESTCYQLIISMDGVPGSKSIELARPGTDGFDLVHNVRELLDLKDEMGSKKTIAVKICERGQDWQEIEQYVLYWLNADVPVDYVCVGKPLKDENEESMRRHPCQYFDNNFMVIRWTGECVPCAYNDKVSNQGMLTYGKISNDSRSLLAVYNNKFISDLRSEQNAGNFREPCSSCSFAYTGYGFEGEVTFRADSDNNKLFYHQDYYNMFFSKKKDWKPKTYYFQEFGEVGE